MLGDTGAARFDLTLSLTRTPAGVRGRLEYNTDLFEGTTAERIAERYVQVVTAAAQAPDRPVDELAVLPAANSPPWPTGRPVPRPGPTTPWCTSCSRSGWPRHPTRSPWSPPTPP
ncbi:condensation domain-containing protein [Kitasatospora gansuensis]